MALVKNPLNINFSQGVDTKTDPYQVSPGKFLSLQNSIFDKGGQLQKRNGYGPLAPLPATTTFLTTFNGNLTAIGQKLYALSEGTNSWITKSNLQPISLSVLPSVRSGSNQSQTDSVIASNGLMCIVYTDQLTSGTVYKYSVIDSITGQSIINPTLIPAQGGGTVTGSPRVFIIGTFFVVIYTNVISATAHLDFIGISIINPSLTPTQGEITSAYVAKTPLSWDAVAYGDYLYIGYNSLTGGQNIAFRTINNNLVVSGAVVFAGEICTNMSMCVDSSISSVPIIWAAYYDSAGSTGKVIALNSSLTQVLAPTTIISTGSYTNITSVAQNAGVFVYLEKANNYSYDSSIPSHFIQTKSVTQAGSVSSISTVIRSVGLASKAFLYKGVPYFLSVYQSPFQPTYFLINASTSTIVARLAYSNGGGYLTVGLPSVTLSGSVASVSYLFKDLLQASSTNASQTTVPNVYSQDGINTVYFDFSVSQITSGEIGKNLNFSGGFVTSYDGVAPVEQGFFIWPDSVETTVVNSGGSMSAQQYYYQVVYEWTDNQGNLFRSAPSIPVGALTTMGSSSVTVDIPTLRLTYKTNTPVNIVIYRWSAAQQIYYQVTSITSPLLNTPASDSVSYTDTASDASILGNNIIYTNGGVLENTSPPATDLMTLFDNRLFILDSEDRNLLRFSKQVIEATPVEMSDLLTLYAAPTIASQGSTGPITAMSPMDDKLVLFKANALGFINGSGPDNTGANNQYSNFTLINSVVGCTNQLSIVFTPAGLMFQSNKGIWLLGRDLSTQYIGAPVEGFTANATVESALNIPTTNQVRFTLSSGITLVYDYYYQQWGTFANVPAVSSTIYQNLHTYVDVYGRIFQETPGQYLDNSSPVLMSFTTGWMNLAGLQGYERFYFLYLLGQYITPFKLNVQIAYNYNPSPWQSTIVTPEQKATTWGSDALWGDAQSWGSTPASGWQDLGTVFEARVFPQQQKCESFQLIVSELFDASQGAPAGAGLTLSGLNLVVGSKKAFRTNSSGRNFG